MSTRERADRELALQRYRSLRHETTDPLAARLLDEIVSEMEADLKADDSEGKDPACR
jgi:hypothetical protein